MSGQVKLDKLPDELIGYICEALTEDDTDYRESLETLAKLARVCKNVSGPASRELANFERELGQPIEFCHSLRTGDLEAVKRAIQKGWQIDECITLCGNFDRIKGSVRMRCWPLWIAAAAGHLHIVRYLVESGANIDPAPEGERKFARADALKPFADAKLPIDQRFKKTRSPLYVPSFNTWPDLCFDSVVSLGSHMWRASSNPLRLALVNQHTDVAAYLSIQGAVLIEEDIELALRYGCWEVVKLALARGVNEKMMEALPFRIAESSHAMQLAPALVAAGADLNARFTLEEIMVDRCDLRIGGYFNHRCGRSYDGQFFEEPCGPDAQVISVLGHACSTESYDYAHFLLDHGADPRVGQTFIWDKMLIRRSRFREVARLLDRLIKAGLDVNHLAPRCKDWATINSLYGKGAWPGLVQWGNESNGEVVEDEEFEFADGTPYADVASDDDMLDDISSDSEFGLEDDVMDIDGDTEMSNGDGLDGDEPKGVSKLSKKDRNTNGYGLPLFRHVMDDFGDGTKGFIEHGNLDVARTLLKHGASMAEASGTDQLHKNLEPTHHAPRCSLYDSLDTGSVLWFWAFCRQHFDLCDLLRQYGAPVPQTDDELKLTLVMAFYGRSEKGDTFPKYPHIALSEYPYRATFGDAARRQFMGPNYRGNILKYLTTNIAPEMSFLKKRESRDSWLKEYEFGFLIDEV